MDNFKKKKIFLKFKDIKKPQQFYLMRSWWRMPEWISPQLLHSNAVFDALKAVFYLSFWVIWLSFGRVFNIQNH